MRRRIKWFIGVLIAVLVGALFFHDQNNRIVVTEHEIDLDIQHGQELAVVHLSDLHSKGFGTQQQKLLTKVSAEKPDLIFMTGDLIDAKKADSKEPLELMRGLVQLAPVYFVTGNHEWWSGEYGQLEQALDQLGVVVLRNESMNVTVHEREFTLIGIDDPAMLNQEEEQTVVEFMQQAMDGNNAETDFTLLLAHRPDFFYLYQEFDIDLVLSGHAHGGQIGLPYNGGLVAPNQGFFPKYVKGAYEEDETIMIVHRGLGNSIIPQRLFNQPEVIRISIK
ncbi:metallophosphoesterase [Alkalihalobacillus pseudalcaliphilus]|uniref:metallophosphoesterase n=1 Tax=Alkalihalobacillus pseudalcaliphilus TaxID=79884 RepID=UPI00064DAB37|nr:metallophosphoesterase [Alkalihalobacillus pseudalcaliphilus]KMK75525.1 phosphoesterase [Alkalihalobacillus pseudalcaliphilus]